MMECRLRNRLGALESMLVQTRQARRLMGCWMATAGALGLLFLIRIVTPWNTTPLWWPVAIIGLIVAWSLWRRADRRPANFRELVQVIARENPEVRHLLAAAVEQEPNPESGEFGYLQLRVIEEALMHPDALVWEDHLTRKLNAAKNAQMLALVVMLGVFYFGAHLTLPHFRMASSLPLFSHEIVVTPGDTQIERGSGLVITARFGAPPAEASLVLVSTSGKTQRLPLARNLADPVFGASLLEVSEDALYHIEYAGKKTRDFKISVFDYPALVRADADLQFPSYTGLAEKTIRDTRRVSAVEGTRLTYTLQLNKPVARARLVRNESNGGALDLTLRTNAIAELTTFGLTNSTRYSLQLVDAEGRTNKVPSEFVIQVLPNRPPEIKIAFPRGDQRVSRLEEMQLQAEARDDFGLLKYGVGFGVSGQEPQFVELGQSAPAGEKRQFNHQIALEKLGVQADQLVSYFAWAEDYGPDGQVRRTFSDIFFAEVRPFDEIFRADQSGASESQSQSQGGEQGGNQGRLAEMQKQIVIATWKLQQSRTAAQNGSKP